MNFCSSIDMIHPKEILLENYCRTVRSYERRKNLVFPD